MAADSQLFQNVAPYAARSSSNRAALQPDAVPFQNWNGGGPSLSLME